MSKERPILGQGPDPYWNADEQIGQVRLWDRDWFLRLQAHVGEETWYRAKREDELIPLRERRGTRTYVHGKPYLLEPGYRIAIALDPDARLSAASGRACAGA